jgi:hypothetical protein
LSTLITNRHSMARIGVLDVVWPALYRPDEGVWWIRKALAVTIAFFTAGFRASRAPCISCNTQPSGVLELAKLERRAPQSR